MGEEEVGGHSVQAQLEEADLMAIRREERDMEADAGWDDVAEMEDEG